MSQRCAENWDGFCEYFYREHGREGTWPNNRQWPNTIHRQWENELGLPTQLTVGEQLLRNTAEKKYCSYLNCEPVCEPFDPNNPDSPSITYYKGHCIPTCSVDTSAIDDDPVMNRMLENPRAAAGTLINICNTARNNKKDLSGTKIGGVCERYLQNYNKKCI
jgi:hypothetical protein